MAYNRIQVFTLVSQQSSVLSLHLDITRYLLISVGLTIAQINSFCLRAAGMSNHQGFDHQDRADGPKLLVCLNLANLVPTLYDKS